jgi:hypothetical protein
VNLGMLLLCHFVKVDPSPSKLFGLTNMNATAREEGICTRTLNSNAKYLIALALAIPMHRMGQYLPKSNQCLLGVSNKY